MAKKTNFESNGKQYFRITKTIGKKSDGTPIRKQFYGEGKKEAEEKANEFMNNLKVGLINPDQKFTINILLPKWLFTTKKHEIKASSFESYEGTYRNYIKDYLIADLPISNIKSLTVQEHYNELLKKGISISNIIKTHKLLNQFFSYTEKEGFILKNPCSNVTLPKPKKEDVETIIFNKKQKASFNRVEIKIILDAFSNSKYYNVILFALNTGMREGEILGLQWKNINFEDREIYVVDSLNRVAEIEENGERTYKTVLQTPKTENSIRIVPMSPAAYSLLNSLPRTSNFVFNRNGDYMDAKDLQKNWRKTLLKLDIPYRKFHDLRHTFATMFLTNGADLVTTKELLGHSNIKTTEGYLDSLHETQKKYIQKFNITEN